MNSTFRRMFRRHDDRGAVAVTVAILLMVFILLAALVVDAGYWYNVRRQLQSAADAAALAGCWQLIKSGSDVETNASHYAAVLATATQYANNNAVVPAGGLQVVNPTRVSTTTGHHYTQITNKYVQVTVETTAPAFFATVLGYTGDKIMAQSRAESQWVSGLKGIVPFTLPVLDVPKTVTVSVDGGDPVELFDPDGDGKYQRNGVPVGRQARGEAYALNFNVVNKWNVSTPLVTVGSANEAIGVIVRPSNAEYTDIWLDKYVLTYGADGFTLHVASPLVPTKLKVNGTSVAGFFPDGDGVWKAYVPASVLESPSGQAPPLSESFPVALTWDKGNSGFKTVAWVVVRRPSFPIKDAYASPHVAASGVIDVVLELNKFKYGNEYDLKISASGGEVGNFAAVNLDSIYHPPYYGHPDPTEYSVSGDRDSVYKTYLKQAFPYEIHIGDVLWTYTGGMGTPTDRSLEQRFAGDTWTWDSWNRAGRPLTKRLVFVPVVEKREVTDGTSPLIVVSFASFFIERVSDGGITGFFIEYVAGGQGSSGQPPSGYSVLTPRLVATGLDF